MGLLARIRGWSAEAVRPPFERTVCSCHRCVDFCKTQPGILIPSDLPRISARLIALRLIDTDRQIDRYLAPLADVAAREANGGAAVQIPRVSPARNERGHCVFLDGSNRCRIHEVSPFGCAYFDAHMDKAEIERRKSWANEVIRVSSRYRAVREALVERQNVKKS